MQQKKFVEFIQQYISDRKKTDPKYTMRALADEVGVNRGIFSSLMSGKRKLTRITAEDILKQMNVPVAVMNRLLTQMTEEFSEVHNLSQEVADALDVLSLAILALLETRSSPLPIKDLVQILERDDEEVLKKVQYMLDAKVIQKEGDSLLFTRKIHLHPSPAVLKQSTLKAVELIQQNCQEDGILATGYPAQFLIASTDQHVKANMRGYYTAVESIIRNFQLDSDESKDVYLGFTYMMKVDPKKL